MIEEYKICRAFFFKTDIDIFTKSETSGEPKLWRPKYHTLSVVPPPNQVCFRLPLKKRKAPDRRTQCIVLLEFAGIPFLLKSDSFPTNDQAVVAVDQCESRYGASIFIETTEVGLNNNDEASKDVVMDFSIKLSENISYLSSVPLTQAFPCHAFKNLFPGV